MNFVLSGFGDVAFDPASVSTSEQLIQGSEIKSTNIYHSPEQIDAGADGEYNAFTTDVWRYGVTLCHCVLTSLPPL